MDNLPPRNHNNPPEDLPYDAAILADLANDTAAHISASEAWLPVEIDSEEQASRLADQINGLRQLFKRADDARKTAKKPWDDKGKEVQAAFAPILDRIEKAANLLKPKAAAWAKRKADEEAERKRREQDEARKAQEAARLAQIEAENSGSIDAAVAAEEAAKAAEKMAAEAARAQSTSIKSASGGGKTLSLRKRRVCTIKAIGAAFLTFREDPEVAEVLVKLANRRANAAGFEGDIPGFNIEIVETLA